jgi:hypothetical protein
LKGGVLIPYIAVSFSHKDAELDKTLSAAREAFESLFKGIERWCSALFEFKSDQTGIQKIQLMFSIKDKVIVVTGGSGLLGGKIIEVLRAQGATALSADIKVPDNDELSIKIDITSEQSVKNAVSDIVAKHGRIDGWIKQRLSSDFRTGAISLRI